MKEIRGAASDGLKFLEVKKVFIFLGFDLSDVTNHGLSLSEMVTRYFEKKY